YATAMPGREAYAVPAATTRDRVTALTTAITTTLPISAIIPTFRSRITSGSPGNNDPIVVLVNVRMVVITTPARMPANAPAAETWLRAIRLAMTDGNSCVT